MVATTFFIVIELQFNSIILFLGGLDKQFTEYECILDHMAVFEDQQKLIFSNYIVMFSHVFKGLQYLHNNGIIHGDIKGYDMYYTM